MKSLLDMTLSFIKASYFASLTGDPFLLIKINWLSFHANIKFPPLILSILSYFSDDNLNCSGKNNCHFLSLITAIKLLSSSIIMLPLFFSNTMSPY